jgi:uncharacterized protein (DUF433 family)
MGTILAQVAVTPGVAGGKPRIAGHRITMHDIAIWHERLGRSADETATGYALSLADVDAALAYYSTATATTTHAAPLQERRRV